MRYGKVFLLDAEKLYRSERFFEKHGSMTTFVGRLLPVIRQLISLPAGFSRMPLGKFCLFTSLGAGIWSLILIILGYLFGSNLELVKQYSENISWALIVLCLFIIGIYAAKRRRVALPQAQHSP